MHGKNSKFALVVLSALLYTQGLLGFAGVTLVVMNRMHADPAAQTALIASAASSDAQVR